MYKLYSKNENPADKNESRIFFKKASDKGHLDSMFYLWCLEDNGLRYLKIAAENGQVDSMHYYSISLDQGFGVEANKEVSLRYLKMFFLQALVEIS